MNSRGLTSRRGILVVVLLVFAVVGTTNVLLRRQVSFRVAREGHRVVVSQFMSPRSAEQHGLREGDTVRAIDGTPVHGLPEASWLLSWIPSYGQVQLTLARGDSVLTVNTAADRRTPLLYLLLDRLTALAFLVLGMLVWWQGHDDKMVTAFLRVNLVIGCAILWDDFPSVLSSSPAFQAVFAAIYLSVRSFIPAVLVDFIYRFTYSQESALSGRIVRWVFYAIAAVVAVFSSVFVVMARVVPQTEWMAYFDIFNRLVYGGWLLLGMALIVGRLAYVARNAENAWRRKQMRWLLLCLVAGATPYVVLEKLPTLWGWSPLISPDLSRAMLIITPIGWAMAVASFRMLRVQWTLSRTFVYVVTAGIAIYTLGGFTLLSSTVLHRNLLAPTVMLFLLALLLIVLLSRALVDRVRWAVDRAYYGDWFDYRRVEHDLELKLSNSLREQDLGPVLTHDMARVLNVEDCALLVRTGDFSHSASEGEWHVLATVGQGTSARQLPMLPSGTGTAELMEVRKDSGQDGFALAVPLTHAEDTRGWLLLGRKTSGAPFSERDRRLLNFLSPLGGMALANVELNRRLIEHERRSAVIGLAGGIAHEIGNALSPLMGQAQLLEFAAQKRPEQLSGITVGPPLKIITEMCARIRRIVQNLSQLSQPIALEQSVFNLNEVVEEAIVLMSETAGRIKRYQLENGGPVREPAAFRLRKELGTDLPVVRADRQHLSQVFINLILNAADAMEADGHGVLTVGTCISVDPPGVVGFVQDTGPGIPTSYADKLFLPYFTTKPQGKGTGLGLSFARSIVEAHQGWITARSLAEGGARFEFFLPTLLSDENEQLHSQ